MDDPTSSSHEKCPTKDGAVDGPTHVVRSSVWCPDGSIVLQAKNRQYRVHTSVLTNHYEVFKDMLAVGNAEGGEFVEGCPVVQIYDKSRDVIQFLNALYNRSTIDTQKFTSFQTVSSVAKLSKKYGMRIFYSRAVACITATYPDSLEEFSDVLRSTSRIKDAQKNLAEMLHLAKTLNVLCVLPQIYYLCYAQFNMEGVSSNTQSAADRTALISAEQLLCVRGMEHVHRESLKALRDCAEEIMSSDCEHSYGACYHEMMDAIL